jgi:hypothetical protein
MKWKFVLQTSFGLGLAIFMMLLCPVKATTNFSLGATHEISDLAWLSGDWQTPPGKAQIDEHWTMPAGGSMMGLSRTVVGGSTVQFEYLRIEQRADGIYYVAHPKAQCPGTDFKLTSLSSQNAIFENPKHDFPKRIIYKKTPEGSLVASIDGGVGTKTLTFTYRPITR